MKKEIVIEGIGKVIIAKSRSYKNIRLSVNGQGQVRISAPAIVSDKEALRFVHSKKDWIKKAISKQENKQSATKLFDEKSQFNTYAHQLVINRSKGDSLQAQIQEKNLQINIPNGIPIENDQVQNFIKKAIIHTLTVEAKAYLPLRTQQLAERNNFQIAQIRVKNNKSNWGSCSYQNNINLNIHLMRLPKHLIDYVILHELCHTIHRNHGEGFWKLLDKLSAGKAKAYAREMKKYNPQQF